MKALQRIYLAILAVALLAVANNQAITRGFIYANIGSLFTWSGSAQSSWNGSNQVATYGDFTTFVRNNGACATPYPIPAGVSANLALMTYGVATGCAVNTSVHTPILANASFQSACSGWALAGTTGTGLFSLAPACVSGTDQDADGYYSAFTTPASASCAAGGSSTCAGTTAQTFTISGSTPTAQTLSFYYQGVVHATTGDTLTCNSQTGAVGISVVINGSPVSLGSLTIDGSWHQVNVPSITALVSGSNTITFKFTGTSTKNIPYDGTLDVCKAASTSYNGNVVNIDNVALTATY